MVDYRSLDPCLDLSNVAMGRQARRIIAISEQLTLDDNSPRVGA